MQGLLEKRFSLISPLIWVLMMEESIKNAASINANTV